MIKVMPKLNPAAVVVAFGIDVLQGSPAASSVEAQKVAPQLMGPPTMIPQRLAFGVVVATSDDDLSSRHSSMFSLVDVDMEDSY